MSALKVRPASFMVVSEEHPWMRTCVAHLNISVGIGALAGVEGLRGVVLLRRSRRCRSSVVLAPKPATLWLPSSSSASPRACT